MIELEKYLIPATEAEADFYKVNPKYGSKIQIKFLDKTFTVEVVYATSYEKDGNTIGNLEILKKQANALRKILPVLNKLSLEYKSEIIKDIQRDAKIYPGEELPDDLNVFDYFVPKHIYVDNPSYNKNGDRIIAIMDPHYKFDPEHGAGIGFKNEKEFCGLAQEDAYI